MWFCNIVLTCRDRPTLRKKYVKSVFHVIATLLYLSLLKGPWNGFDDFLQTNWADRPSFKGNLETDLNPLHKLCILLHYYIIRFKSANRCRFLRLDQTHFQLPIHQATRSAPLMSPFRADLIGCGTHSTDCRYGIGAGFMRMRSHATSWRRSLSPSTRRKSWEHLRVKGKAEEEGTFLVLIAPLIMGVSIELWCQLFAPVVV